MSAMDREIVEITSRIRTDPKWLIPFLEERAAKFNGLEYSKYGDPEWLTTNEGAAAVHECIDCLKKQTPIGAVTWSDALMEPAKFHCNDIGPKG